MDNSVTSISIAAPLAPSVNNHTYFCLIVKVLPAMLIRALRPDGPVFGATE